jgi:hypothetical protein
MTLGSNQPLTEISTRNTSWGDKGGRCVRLTTLPSSWVDCLEIWEPQPPGTLRAWTGIALHFTFLIQSSVGEFLVNELLRLLMNSWRYKHCYKARICFHARLPLHIYLQHFFHITPFYFWNTLCVSLMLQREHYHQCGSPGSTQGQSMCSMDNKVPTG